MSTSPTGTTSADARPSGTPVKPEPPPLEFKRLTAACSRGAFSCGTRDIDKWFRDKALKHHSGLRSRVVTAHLLDNPAPVGFYALTMKLEKDSLLDRERRIFSRSEGGYFSSVQLCWLAVQKGMQRMGLGTVLMGAVLDDFYEVATRTGVFAMTLVAIDRGTVAFYERLGFVQYGDPLASMPRMLLPAQSVIDARAVT